MSDATLPFRRVSDWTGKRVLVTGAGGFIGSHLVEELVRRGGRVRGMVRYNARGDRGALEWIDRGLAEEVEVFVGDLRDAESVDDAVRETEVVFHLGALIAIPYSYANPRSFFESNVIGTLNVAVASRRHEIARLVHTSTSEVYGTAQQVPITETHPLSAQSPYAASKIGADQLVASFHRTFALPAAILRPFNTFGPRQSARALLPTIVSQALAGGPVHLGSLTPRRDLTFVGDTVEGFLALASSDRAIGEALQLGTGEDPSVAEVVELVSEVLGRPLEVVQEERRLRPPGSEVERLISSPERMRRLTGWEPRTSLRDGIAALVSYVGTHPDRYRVDEYAV